MNRHPAGSTVHPDDQRPRRRHPAAPPDEDRDDVHRADDVEEEARRAQPGTARGGRDGDGRGGGRSRPRSGRPGQPVLAPGPRRGPRGPHLDQMLAAVSSPPGARPATAARRAEARGRARPRTAPRSWSSPTTCRSWSTRSPPRSRPRGLDLDLLAHPQVVVRREALGALMRGPPDVEPDDAGRRRHWSRAGCGSRSAAARRRRGRRAAQRRCSGCSTDVREAVEDWPRMRTPGARPRRRAGLGHASGAGQGHHRLGRAAALAGRRPLHLPRLPRVPAAPTGPPTGRQTARGGARHRPGHPAPGPGRRPARLPSHEPGGVPRGSWRSACSSSRRRTHAPPCTERRTWTTSA